MAAVAAAPGSAGSSGTAGAAARPASEIRFKEIAHYVGLSLVRNPNAQRHPPRGHRALPFPGSNSDLELPTPPSRELPSDTSQEFESPGAHQYGKADRLRRELEWLRTEQRAESEHLRKLETCLSDSVLVQKKAQQRIAKQQEMVNLHSSRQAEMDKRMGWVRDQLAAADAAPRREKRAVALETPQATQPPSREGPVEQPRLGLLAQSAHRAAARDGASASGGSPLLGRSLDRSVGSAVTVYEQQWPHADEAPAIVADCGLAKAPNTGSTAMPATPPPRRRPRIPSEASILPVPPQMSADEEQELNEGRRVRVRQEMIKKAGSARVAFKTLDLNGSGSVSSQEFSDGVSRMGVNWQGLTGLKRPRELFSLFDEERKYAISFQDLFPEDASSDDRPGTPEFWKAYRRAGKEGLTCNKSPSWTAVSAEDKKTIEDLVFTQQYHANEKHKWIRSTMRRLKTRGKSDSRCREVVALHLPRGSGAKDVEGVASFSKTDLKNTKRVYSEEINVPMRKLWKEVGVFKDQRKEQKRVVELLHGVTAATDARQQVANDLASFGGVNGLFSKKGEDDGRPSHSAGSAGTDGLGPMKKEQLFGMLAEECDATPEDVESLHKDFINFADTSEMLNKRGFIRLLQLLLRRETQDSETDAWWEQVQQPLMPGILTAVQDNRPGSSGSQDGGGASKSSRRAQCSFMQFCIWWAESEDRANE